MPDETQKKVTAACGKYEDFKTTYVRLRPLVIENGDWLQKLVPEFWKALVAFDKGAAHYDAVFSLVCRVLVGDKTVGALP